MNKQQLVEFVRVSILKKEPDADSQMVLHYKRVEQATGYAFDALLAQIKLDDIGKAKIESNHVKHYYKQPVSESNGYRYFGVSDDVASVGSGIWYVQPSGGGDLIPYFSRPSNSLFANMAVGEVMNKTFWRFGNLATKKQIIIENIGDGQMADIRLVDYGIVRAFASYEDTEEVVVPDGNYPLLIQITSAWLSNGYVDNSNNNA